MEENSTFVFEWAMSLSNQQDGRPELDDVLQNKKMNVWGELGDRIEDKEFTNKEFLEFLINLYKKGEIYTLQNLVEKESQN